VRAWIGVPVVALALALGWAAHAEDAPRSKPKPATRRVQGVRPWAYKRLERAHAALGEANYAACHEALRELQDNASRLNDHERALTWQTLGYVQASEEDYAGAATSFEHSLEGDGLPEAAKNDVRYNLAQLYVILKRYDDALATFHVWFESVEDPPASAHYLLAMTYMQVNQPAKALPHARTAVQESDEPRESWLQLLLSLLIEQSEFREALPVVQELVARFPKKTYWLQLSAVHSRLGQHRKALGALEAAYDQGLLTESTEITRLAQLYLYNGVPYRAAEVLEAAFEAKTVEQTAETWELVANALLQARERTRALGPLSNAARLSGDGEIYVRLAQVQLDQEQWGDARTSLTAALRKGGLKDPGQAHLLLGIANASEERWDDARRAFTAAKGYEGTKDVAAQWLASVDGEQKLEAAEAGDDAPTASDDAE